MWGGCGELLPGAREPRRRRAPQVPLESPSGRRARVPRRARGEREVAQSRGGGQKPASAVCRGLAALRHLRPADVPASLLPVQPLRQGPSFTSRQAAPMQKRVAPAARAFCASASTASTCLSLYSTDLLLGSQGHADGQQTVVRRDTAGRVTSVETPVQGEDERLIRAWCRPRPRHTERRPSPFSGPGPTRKPASPHLSVH